MPRLMELSGKELGCVLFFNSVSSPGFFFRGIFAACDLSVCMLGEGEWSVYVNRTV